MDSDMPAPRSERRDAAENRRRILEVAQELFDRYGVERVSMNQIARAASVGPGTLYRRYGNKSELCFDLIRDHLTAFLADVQRYLEQNQAVPPRARAREVIRRFIDFREKKLHLLAGVENAPRANPSGSYPPGGLYDELHRCFVRLFDEIASAEGTCVNSVFKADMLITALDSDSYFFQREVRGYSQEAFLEQICSAFL